MNVLIDTNVWLDIILKRTEFFTTSAQAVSLLDRPEHSAFVSAHAVTTLFYLISRARDQAVARTAIAALLDEVTVAGVDDAVLRGALSSDFEDFEDSVVENAAHRAGLDAIVTRNASDFAESRLPVYTPVEFVASQTA